MTHVLRVVPYSTSEDMFVEGPRKVALEEFVVVNGLGDETADKLKVAEVIAVDEGGWVDGVGDPIGGRNAEETVIWVENLPAHEEIPFAE